MRKSVMRFDRVLGPLAMSCAAAVGGCGGVAESAPDIGSKSERVSVPKSYPRKIYVHVMPWFVVGGQHWTMKSRNSATGIASWYSPMIGEYNSGDGYVIEYQLLTMKYARIDGVLIDWPALDGAFDRPQNPANTMAMINKTAAFGLDFDAVYEYQYEDSA